MTYELPPIVKTAERLLKEVERAVRQWPRYHKYAHGKVLREQAMHVAQLTHRAWRDRSRQTEWIKDLAFAVDDLKLSLQLGSQIEAFVSFPQFEMLARIARALGKQVGGWQKHLKGQNARSSATEQRPQTLSTHAASTGANP